MIILRIFKDVASKEKLTQLKIISDKMAVRFFQLLIIYYNIDRIILILLILNVVFHAAVKSYEKSQYLGNMYNPQNTNNNITSMLYNFLLNNVTVVYN